MGTALCPPTAFLYFVEEHINLKQGELQGAAGNQKKNKKSPRKKKKRGRGRTVSRKPTRDGAVENDSDALINCFIESKHLSQLVFDGLASFTRIEAFQSIHLRIRALCPNLVFSFRPPCVMMCRGEVMLWMLVGIKQVRVIEAKSWVVQLCPPSRGREAPYTEGMDEESNFTWSGWTS